MSIRSISAALAVSLIFGLALSANAAPKSRVGKSGKNFKITVNASYKNLNGEAEFVVKDGEQFKMIDQGDKVFRHKNSKGEKMSLEFKKWAFIVNILPASTSEQSDKVMVQIQIELSGPAADGFDIGGWQYQSEVTLTKGKTLVLSGAPGRAEILLTDAD